MPFALLVVVASALMGGAIRPVFAVLIWAFVVVALVSADWWRPASLRWGYPWAQYAHALPAVGLGWLFGALSAHALKWRLAGLISILFALLAAFRQAGVAESYATGIAMSSILVLPLAFTRNWPADRLARYTFGIYLVHPVIIMVARKLGLDGQFVALPFVVLFSLGVTALVHRAMPRFASRFM